MAEHEREEHERQERARAAILAEEKRRKMFEQREQPSAVHVQGGDTHYFVTGTDKQVYHKT